jgi:hypothetical protein
MADLPAAALAAAESAIRDQFRDDLDRPGAPEADALARAALEAAAPLLADEIARKILAHMEEHIADPDTTRLTRTGETNNRAARRHFRTAAQIAGLAFYTREDQLRLAAEAIGRGDFIACDIPGVPGAEPR